MNGALDSDRVELIDGSLVTKMGKEPPHMWTVDSLEEFLRPRLSAARGTLRRESPVRILKRLPGKGRGLKILRPSRGRRPASPGSVS